MIAPELKAELEAFSAVPRSTVELVLWGITKAVEAEREACARICDSHAEANREEAQRRGEALGRDRTSGDKQCAALWDNFHAAEEIAAQIRARQ